MSLALVLDVVGCVLVFIAALYSWPPSPQPVWRPALFPLGVGLWMVGHLMA